jgi:hypothetical protein
MTDVLTIERGEVGYRERANGATKYGEWLAAFVDDVDYRTGDWCAMGQMWCINQAGQSEYAGGVDKAFAYVQNWVDWFQDNGKWSTKPGPRKLVFFDWRNTPSGANHVGMVDEVHDDHLITVEFNRNNRCVRDERPRDGQIMGYGDWWPGAHILDDSCWMG